MFDSQGQSDPKYGKICPKQSQYQDLRQAYTPREIHQTEPNQNCTCIEYVY